MVSSKREGKVRVTDLDTLLSIKRTNYWRMHTKYKVFIFNISKVMTIIRDLYTRLKNKVTRSGILKSLFTEMVSMPNKKSIPLILQKLWLILEMCTEKKRSRAKSQGH